MMKAGRRGGLILAAGMIGAFAPALAATGPVQSDHIEVELVAAATSVEPGTPLKVGLRMLPDPGWHTYWKNPGDSGLPTTLDWTLPEGAQASDIAWPYPEAMPMGHLINYGYEDEHLLPVTIDVPARLTVGDEFRIEVRAEWLVCEEICIPGDADLSLTLPVRTATPETDSRHADLFDWAAQRQPERVD